MAAEDQVTRILLVEDHASFRQALAYLFDSDPEFAVVAQAGSVQEARETVKGSQEIDVAVVDLGLPDGDGVELIQKLSSDMNITTLVLSASTDYSQFARAVEAGAAGVLHKAAAVKEVVNAVRRLQAGEALLLPGEVVAMLRAASVKRQRDQDARLALAKLTSREREVLDALAEGLDGREIAEKLHITPETERTHMVNILNKLGAHSRLHALVLATRYGIVEIS